MKDSSPIQVEIFLLKLLVQRHATAQTIHHFTHCCPRNTPAILKISKIQNNIMHLWCYFLGDSRRSTLVCLEINFWYIKNFSNDVERTGHTVEFIWLFFVKWNTTILSWIIDYFSESLKNSMQPCFCIILSCSYLNFNNKKVI